MILIVVVCFLVFQYQFAYQRMAIGELMDEQEELYNRLNEVTTQTADMVQQNKKEMLDETRTTNKATPATEKNIINLLKQNNELSAKLKEVATQMAATDKDIINTVKQNKDELSAKLNEVATNMAAMDHNKIVNLVKQNKEDWQKESASLRTLLTTDKVIIEGSSTSSVKESSPQPPSDPPRAEATIKEVANLRSSRKTKATSTEAANYPSYPETKYTEHVKGLLQVIDDVTLHLPDNASNPWSFDPHKYCAYGYHIFVDKPFSPPTVIECNPDNVWCQFFIRLFEDGKRILPYNVSVGESQADMIKKGSMGWGQCFASSGPEGGFSMNNFQDAKAQVEEYGSTATGYAHKHARVWWKRHKTPVFRGHPRMRDKGAWQSNPGKCPKRTVEDGEYGHRSRAVLFSLDNPNLLDARVSDAWHACLVHNATNGMDKVFGLGKHKRDEVVQIPSTEYYTDYQVAVVLGGIGAAFRTPVHLSAGQAIVLQRFSFEEWFVPYMTPWVHYIPLKEDLSDLKTIMEWVRDNQNKVKSIAENGKKFYEEWLSFPQTNEHWHELLWRLSELIYHKGPERLKTGAVRTIWPGPIVPIRFIRDPKTGKFVEEERSKTRQPYLDYDVPLGEKTQS
jgi:Glycosyl transferase family 90